MSRYFISDPSAYNHFPACFLPHYIVCFISIELFKSNYSNTYAEYAIYILMIQFDFIKIDTKFMRKIFEQCICQPLNFISLINVNPSNVQPRNDKSLTSVCWLQKSINLSASFLVRKRNLPLFLCNKVAI